MKINKNKIIGCALVSLPLDLMLVGGFYLYGWEFLISVLVTLLLIVLIMGCVVVGTNLMMK